jgi:dolichol-phosphate mannosyltransferase
MSLLTDLDIKDSSDFKLLDRRVVEAHNRLPESSRFFRGIVSWLGFKTSRIPFTVGERPAGRSRWTVIQLLRLAVNAATSFSAAPLHLITLMGFCILALSVILGAEALYTKFAGTAVSGFTTVILLLLFIGSMLMVSLGIIGAYIARIYEEVKRRPGHLIDETVGFSRTRDSVSPPGA